MRGRALAICACAVALTSAAACSHPDEVPPVLTYVDEHTLYGPRNFLAGYEVKNADGTYNMAVEIPTGTSEKWEICTRASLAAPARFPGCTVAGREMVHEVRAGVRRIVSHIGYPGNYGALVQTSGGDGDPVDVIAIGPAAERGSVIAVRVVGVIQCADGGEQDDKVVALTRDSPLFQRVSTAAELEAAAPQAGDIIHRWFMAYKGRDSDMACAAMADETVAAALIDRAHAAFAKP